MSGFEFRCIKGPNKGDKRNLDSAQESRDIAFCEVCKCFTYLSDAYPTDQPRLCTSHWARVRVLPKHTTNANQQLGEPS